MVETIFMDPFVINVILPFLLLFVVSFAILRKTKVLGENKFADVLVAMVIAFLFIAVPQAVGVTLKIIPIISVFLVIILCYYLIFGFLEIHRTSGALIALGIIFALAFIGTILWATGVLEKILINEKIIGTIIMIIVLGGAIALVFAIGGTKKGG